MQHLILYDGTCGLCRRLTTFFSRIDKEGIFAFSPIQGKTAQKFLTKEEIENLDTFYMIENFEMENHQKWMRGKGVFRSLWLVGGIAAIFGALYLLPSFLVDPAYRLVARTRRYFFGTCRLEDFTPLPRQFP